MTNEETDQDDCMEEFAIEEIQSAIDRLNKRQGEGQQRNTGGAAKTL